MDGQTTMGTRDRAAIAKELEAALRARSLAVAAWYGAEECAAGVAAELVHIRTSACFSIACRLVGGEAELVRRILA